MKRETPLEEMVKEARKAKKYKAALEKIAEALFSDVPRTRFVDYVLWDEAEELRDIAKEALKDEY